MRTQKTPARNRGKKPDAAKFAVPPRHDSARQALGDLRRMIDAERHRIRREFIPRRQIIRIAGRVARDARGSRHLDGENLMAEALAVTFLCRSILPRRCLAVRRLLLLLAVAVVVQHVKGVSRDHKHGDDGDEKAGAEKAQEADG